MSPSFLLGEQRFQAAGYNQRQDFFPNGTKWEDQHATHTKSTNGEFRIVARWYDRPGSPMPGVVL
jgi:hypothetical protein